LWITAQKLWRTGEKQPNIVEKTRFFVDKPLEKKVNLVEKFWKNCGLTGSN